MNRCFAILAAGLLAACAQTGLRSERVFNDFEVAGLPTGISRADLLARLGPPAEEMAFPRLNETVASWRVVEAGNHRVLLNAHLDPSGQVKSYSRSLDPTAIGEGMSN